MPSSPKTKEDPNGDTRVEPGAFNSPDGASGASAKTSDAIDGLRKADLEINGILHSKLIPGLDALRALAISLVLLDHLRIFDHVLSSHPQTGGMGVMIFFVLSGFLITWLLLREYERTGTISLRNFYRRRTLRIFPSFYVCLALTSSVEVVTRRFEWPPALISFFYMMDYGRGLHPAWMSMDRSLWISWSLAVEEKFYLCWPLLLLLLLRKRSTLARNLALIIVGQWIYRAILYLGFHITLLHLYCTFDTRADSLLVGCLVAILVENDRTRLFCCWLLRWQWLSLIPPLIVCFLIVWPDPDTSSAAVLLAAWTLQPVVIAAMLLQFVYWGSKSWTICSNVLVRFIAHISYALYLYHPLGGLIAGSLHRPHVGYLTVLFTTVLTLGSYYLVERPIMRLRDRKKLAPAAPAVVAAP